MLTLHPLKRVLKKTEFVRRLARIAIELREYDIKFMPRRVWLSSKREKAIPMDHEIRLLLVDCTRYTHSCDKCQNFTLLSHVLPILMTRVNIPSPFYKWGLDIVGHLPQAIG